MKKLLLVLLAVSFLIVLSGCELFNGQTDITIPTTTETTKTTETTTEGTTTVPATTTMTTTTTTQVITHIITFDVIGGTSVDSMSALDGESITLPVTTRDGYVFEGWLSEGVMFTEEDPVTSDLTLTADWNPIDYTIVFEENGGSSVTDLTAAYESAVGAPADPTKQGYTFDGWYEDVGLTTLFVFDTMPFEGTTLYAKWEPALVDVTINHQLETLTGGTYTLVETITTQDYTESTHDADVKDFAGFTYDETHALDMSSGVVLADGSLVLDLYYTRDSVTISFDTDAEFSVSSITQKYESLVSEPEDPTRLGYTFLGWFSDVERTIPYEFEIMPDEDITVYADWQGEPSTIYFMSNGGTKVDPITAENGSDIVLLEPTREGHDFVAWYVTENLSTAFAGTTMPVGGKTLYAKWDKLQYTLSFEENGGSAIVDLIIPYDDPLSPPENPTRTDYVFVGWFTDVMLTEEFIFTNMPAEDVTLYAKWADISDPYSILANTVQPNGTDVTVRGIVYQTMGSDYTGFLIADDTGFVYVDAAHTGLSIGDRVEVSGTLIIEENIPRIRAVTTMQILGTDTVPLTASDIELVDIDGFYPTASTVYNLYRTTGLLFYDSFDGHYYLVNPLTEERLPIAIRSYGSDRLSSLENASGNRVIFEYVLLWKDGRFEAGLVSLVADPYTEAEIVTLFETMVTEYLSGLVFKSGDVFQIPEEDPYGFTTIDYDVIAGAAYYDTENEIFLDIIDGEDKTVTFRLTFTVNANPYTADIDVTVKPVVITTIAELIQGETGNYYQIEATVVSYSEYGLMILKDDTGSVFAEIIPGVEIGDLVRLSVRRGEHQHMVMLYAGDGGIKLDKVISKGNDLNITLNPYDTADMLAIDPTDPTIYGTYVEVRGFLLAENYHFHTLMTDDYTLKVQGFSHSGFEKLMDYQYVEVYIRGYLFTDDDGEVMLFYEGIRRDIRIPEYTDQELVDVIAKILDYTYAGRSFEAFESFELMPYHRMLGGTISWQMDAATEALYNLKARRFTYAMNDTQLSFTITISEGTAQKTIAFNPVLKGIEPIGFANLKQENMDGHYFVRGLVVYWHPNYAYLLEESSGELLFVDMELTDVRKGDIIIVYGRWRTGNYQGGEIYLTEGYGDIPSLVRIASRQNPVSLTAEAITPAVFHAADPFAIDTYTRYVEIEGRLIKEDNYAIVLRTAEGDIYLDFVDEYTYYELDLMQGTYVTVRGFVSEYDYNYAIRKDMWHMRFLGMAGDLAEIEFTDAEKVTIMKQYILDNYQKTLESDSWFDFTGIGAMFPDVLLSYTEISDPDGLIDLTDGYDGYIQETTTDGQITIEASIDSNGTVETFQFTFDVLAEDVSPATTIGAALDDLSLSHIVEGMVISILYDSGDYLLLIEDSSGRLIIRIPNGLYNNHKDYSGYIGDTVRAEGFIMPNEGYHVMMPDAFMVVARNAVYDPAFQAMTLIGLDNLDMTIQDNFGLPVEFAGWVERDENSDYYVTNGNERIYLINNNYYPGSFVGYPVIIRGFTLDENAVLVYDYNYGGVRSMRVNVASDQELVDIIFDKLMKEVKQGNNVLDLIEDNYHSLPSIPYFLRSAFSGLSLEITVLDHEALISQNTYGIRYIQPAAEDVVMSVNLELTYNIATKQGTYELVLEGFEVGTLTDLLTVEAGTHEIVLKGIYLHSGWGFTYFLIDGEVYYLENYSYAWLEEGDEVYLIGKKTMIDGIPNYTFDIYYDGMDVDYSDPMAANFDNIEFPAIITVDTTLDFAPNNGNYYFWVEYTYDVSHPDIINTFGEVTVPIGTQTGVTITVTATHDTTDPDTGDPITLTMQKTFNLKIGNIAMSIADLYVNDFDVNPLQYDYLTIEGKLGYDSFMDMYTLTDDDGMIYIRLDKNDYGDSDIVLWGYIGEYVHLDVMLPMKTVRGDYILVDSIGGYPQLRMVSLTRQEQVDLVAEQLENKYGTMDMMAGDELGFLPTWHNYHDVAIEYTLNDPINEAYVDFEGMYTTYVDELKTILVTVTITHPEDALATASFTMTINIHPYVTTDITDVLWGFENQTYQIEGTIVSLVLYDSGGYNYMIVDDGTGRIMVGLNSVPYGLYGGDDVSLNEGDTVRLIATRFSYASDDIVPVLDNLAYVEVLSTGALTLPTPEVMTFEDILALDYLDIDSYYIYIQIEETLKNVGSTYYPNYVLESDTHLNSIYGNYFELMIEGTDLTAELGGDLSSDVILEGYLFGFDKWFAFYWIIAYENHTLPTT